MTPCAPNFFGLLIQCMDRFHLRIQKKKKKTVMLIISLLRVSQPSIYFQYASTLNVSMLAIEYWCFVYLPRTSFLEKFIFLKRTFSIIGVNPC